MSERVERIIREYPGMVREIQCLREQMRHFEGVTERDIIDSMNYAAPQGERVQTSGVSDKTATIAATYRDRVQRINRDWFDHLARKLMWLEEEVDFFHSALRALSPDVSSLMWDLTVNGMTWDSLEKNHHICRSTVAKHRKKAICELDALYAAREREMADYILR